MPLAMRAIAMQEPDYSLWWFIGCSLLLVIVGVVLTHL
jgi:hypothetical protein